MPGDSTFPIGPVKGAQSSIPDLNNSVFEGHIRAAAVSAAKIATGAAASNIGANGVTGAMLNTGVVKQTVSDGVDETTPTNIGCTGMAVGDEVVSVIVFTTKASIATMAAHAGTLTAAADGITPGTPVDNTGNQYLITWIDKT